MPAVIITSVWKSVGFSMVVYLAGLQSIPRGLLRRGQGRRRGRLAAPEGHHHPAPLLDHLLPVGHLQCLGSFQVFTQIFIMTNGGPLGRTTTIVYHIYQTAFKHFDMGYASAMAFALFAMMFAFTLSSCASSVQDEHRAI